MSLCRIVEPGEAGLPALLHALRERRVSFAEDVASIVARILRDIESRGRAALEENARRFDATHAPRFNLLATEEEIAEASVKPHQLEAIRESIRRVREFHEAQLRFLTEGWEKWDGGWIWRMPSGRGPNAGQEGQRLVPVTSAGIYVPGGKAVYPSSVIMNGVPATVARVKSIAMATPAQPDGTLSPAVLVAAREVGISKILKVGGAAAIAGMASGFEGFESVDVIVGPGNAYVNEAKRQLWGRVGLDGYAGPSEVCVIADESADIEYAAADLLTQVEHSDDNTAYLIGFTRQRVDEILAAAERQLAGLPRERTMRAALQNYSLAVVVSTRETAVEVSDAIAPEHLSLMVEKPEELLEKIHNAGCILLGSNTPQSAGDFASGPSHTLPTAGAARFASPVSITSFLKLQSVGRLTEEDLREILPTIEAFGEMEGFPAHTAGAKIRFPEAS